LEKDRHAVERVLEARELIANFVENIALFYANMISFLRAIAAIELIVNQNVYFRGVDEHGKMTVCAPDCVLSQGARTLLLRLIPEKNLI